MICDNCVWNEMGEHYPLCDHYRNISTENCKCFLSWEMLGEETKKKYKKNKNVKCECGAEAIGCFVHSNYCPKYENKK